jgi:hypothetical protein
VLSKDTEKFHYVLLLVGVKSLHWGIAQNKKPYNEMEVESAPRFQECLLVVGFTHLLKHEINIIENVKYSTRTFMSPLNPGI